MTCPDSTGSCTVSPDGACIAPKVSGVFDSIVITKLIGSNNKITIEFDTQVSRPDETVFCFSRVGTAPFEKRVFAARDNGVISTPEVFSEGDTVDIFLRAENNSEYGEWQHITGTAQDGWEEQAYFVTFNGVSVTNNGESITYFSNGG